MPSTVVAVQAATRMSKHVLVPSFTFDNLMVVVMIMYWTLLAMPSWGSGYSIITLDNFFLQKSCNWNKISNFLSICMCWTWISHWNCKVRSSFFVITIWKNLFYIMKCSIMHYISFYKSHATEIKLVISYQILWVSRQLIYGHFVYRHFVYNDFPCWNRSWSDETHTKSIEPGLMQRILPN